MQSFHLLKLPSARTKKKRTEPAKVPSSHRTVLLFKVLHTTLKQLQILLACDVLCNIVAASLLIVEDDNDINNLICNTLKAEGYQCERAFDGKEGADKIEQNRYDLLLLDIMLPEINGYELLDYVRGIGDTPVIIISAMGQVDERIRGLRMGADDYICKPFQIGELLARVETVLRRTQRMAERLEIEDVAIDPKSRTVTKAGEQVELTVKEFDLLYELMKNKNVALSRRRLYELVWQEEYTGETRTLDSHVQRLRKKLDWNEKIVTVFRIGYRLEVRG